MMKGDIMGTMHYFHEHHVFERSVSATYVALIPKKVGAVELRVFRPISLISGVYIIIAKVLAERLKKVVDRLVNKHQMDFVKSRHIMNATLIATECVDSRTRGDARGSMCKLDIEKAYDHVNWDYLLDPRKQMGFSGGWLKWIDFCIKIVSSQF